MKTGQTTSLMTAPPSTRDEEVTPPFHPHPRLRNGHVMTIANNFWLRQFPVLDRAPVEPRLFDVGEQSQILAFCHWQRQRASRPTILAVHGLEGSADRGYAKGTAEKAWRAGFNVVRMNMRNCGGTEHLSPTLYDSGLSRDLTRVAEGIVECAASSDSAVFIVGFSMGGNQALKMAGEAGDRPPAWLKGVVAISPALDLAACAAAIHRGFNRVYERRFLFSLLRRMKKKARLYPGRFDLSRRRSIRSLRDFDEVFTGPYQGYGTADQYYAKASAIRVADRIRVPTLIVQAKDDPFVPYQCLNHPSLRNNPAIRLLITENGGHVGFRADGHSGNGEDPYWAENRAVEFCRRIYDGQNPKHAE